MGSRAAVQPDVSVNAGVVEEVVPVPLLRAFGRVDDNSRRNGLEGQPIVDAHRESAFFARADVVGDVGLEGEVSADVTGHLDIVDPDSRGVSGGLEMDHDAVAGPAAWDADLALVPDRADMITGAGVGEEVLIRGRNRHFDALRQPLGEPSLGLTVILGVEGEVPHSRQTLCFSGRGVLWPKHHGLPVLSIVGC